MRLTPETEPAALWHELTHLILVRWYGERGPRLPRVPHLGGVVARARDENVCVCRVPAAPSTAGQPAALKGEVDNRTVRTGIMLQAVVSYGCGEIQPGILALVSSQR